MVSEIRLGACVQELLENHWGFDAVDLGFPSIAACRAIVLQTTAGLFGYHMSSSHLTAAARAIDFANYVHNHAQWVAGAGQMLYVICYTEKPITGYGANALSEWKAEAQVFAAALTHTGRRMGYGLSPAHGGLSSYVRVTQSVGMPIVAVAPWDDHAGYIVRAQTAPTANHSWRGQQLPRSIITAVNIPSPPLKQVNVQSLD